MGSLRLDLGGLQTDRVARRVDADDDRRDLDAPDPVDDDIAELRQWTLSTAVAGSPCTLSQGKSG